MDITLLLCGARCALGRVSPGAQGAGRRGLASVWASVRRTTVSDLRSLVSVNCAASETTHTTRARLSMFRV